VSRGEEFLLFPTPFHAYSEIQVKKNTALYSTAVKIHALFACYAKRKFEKKIEMLVPNFMND
jgi:hypothetical protein